MIDAKRLANAISILAGPEVTVFVWGTEDEPVGDIPVGSDEFAQMVLDMCDRLEKAAVPA